LEAGRVATEKTSENPEMNEIEIEKRSDDALKRLLATPPDHRTKPTPDANPKKRGRPSKVK
jgi:hypothetical protein